MRQIPDETFQAIAREFGFTTEHLCRWIARRYPLITAEEYAKAEMRYAVLTDRRKLIP